MNRIDVHQHLIPDSYRDALRAHGITAVGGRDLPSWSTAAALDVMDNLGTSAAILSVSAPGTTFVPTDEAAALARRVNDDTAELLAPHRNRLGFFATLPTPDPVASATEAERALDELGADGVVLLANSNGNYLGEDGADALWSVLDERSAVAFVHPAALPGPSVEGIPPFAADFLLDTTRAAYLLVRNRIRRKYPRIRFVLSHAGGFVPYASHRLAVSITGDTGASPLDTLDDFAGFYYDTALSASSASLPSLMAFAEPGHVVFGSDWPFAPESAGQYFAAGLDTEPSLTDDQKDAINHTNARTLFPRFGGVVPNPAQPNVIRTIRQTVTRRTFRVVAKAMNTR